MYLQRVVRETRGRLRTLAGKAVSGLVGRRAYSDKLEPETLNNILICRINGRLGNTLFLTPLLKYIHETLPHANIDLLVSYPQAKELFDNFPGVRRVMLYPHKKVAMIHRYLRAVREMRSRRYDLVIDPVPESTSGRIAISLCRARYRLGFKAKSQWAPLTHAIPEPEFPMHQGVVPVLLFTQALGLPLEIERTQLYLRFRPAELDAGRALVASLAAGMPGASKSKPTRIFGFFAYGTGFKVLDRSWWVQFWVHFLRLQPEAVPLEFLPSHDCPPVNPRFPSVHIPSTRALTAAITATQMFISVDTGPMHLASSTPTPTVALFHASDASMFGPRKPTDLIIDVSATTPEQVAERCAQLWCEAHLPQPKAATADL